jgi:hypothetical protein
MAKLTRSLEPRKLGNARVDQRPLDLWFPQGEGSSRLLLCTNVCDLNLPAENQHLGTDTAKGRKPWDNNKLQDTKGGYLYQLRRKVKGPSLIMSQKAGCNGRLL